MLNLWRYQLLPGEAGETDDFLPLPQLEEAAAVVPPGDLVREMVIVELAPPEAEYRRRYELMESGLLPVDEMPDCAIRFAAFAPGVTCVLVGGTQIEHLRDNVAAVERGPLPAATQAMLVRFDGSLHIKSDFSADSEELLPMLEQSSPRLRDHWVGSYIASALTGGDARNTCG